MIICIKCKSNVNIESALSDSEYSWPNRYTVYHKCDSCGAGNQLCFQKGSIQNIIVIGAPGPETETVQYVSDNLVEDVANDHGERLNVWYNKKLYSVVARK